MPSTPPRRLFVSRIGASHSGGAQGQDTFRRYHADRTGPAAWTDFPLSLPQGRFPMRQVKTYLRLREGHLSGVTRDAVAQFEATLRREAPASVVLNSSLFGPLAQIAHERGCAVVVQSHNCEFDYFAGEAASRGHLSGELLRAAYRAERSSCEAADLLVALTTYDRERFERLYEPTCTIAVADPFLWLLEQRLERRGVPPDPVPRHGAVFVGSSSHQNLMAADSLVTAWTADLPPLSVIGAVGVELLSRYGERTLSRRGITVSGFLPSLDEALAAAEFMVCPMTLGSGVKVKAIDALANGCRVLASRETLSGFAFAHGSGFVLPLNIRHPGDSIAHARTRQADANAFALALRDEVDRQARALEAALAAIERGR
jgi:hypothetical protein